MSLKVFVQAQSLLHFPRPRSCF